MFHLPGPPLSRAEGLLFLPGLESNPESSLQTEEEARHPCTDAGFNHMLAAGYTAVIPTNYRPSKPWYPLPMFFPSITGIESKLGAPNCEVSGFKLNSTVADALGDLPFDIM